MGLFTKDRLRARVETNLERVILIQSMTALNQKHRQS